MTKPFSSAGWSRRIAAAEPWLAWSGIFVVVLASAGLGRITGSLQGYANAALAAVILVASVACPALGGAALVAGGLLSPFALVTGTQTNVEFPFLLLPVLLAFTGVAVVASRDWRLFSIGSIRAATAFAAAAVVAFAANQLPWLQPPRSAPFGAQLGGLSAFVLSAGAFVFAARALRDRRWLARLTALFLGLSAVHLLGGVVPPLGRVTGFLFQPGADGSLYWTWLVALATGQAAFNRRLPLVVRFLLATLVALGFFVALTQNRDWASGWVPPLAAVAVVLVVGAPRLAPLGLAAAAIAVLWQGPRLVALVLSPDNQYSLSTRLAAWRVITEIVASNPVVGLGPANYYHCTPLHPILGWQVHFSSHNNYLDIVAQTGLIGLACFFWFAWAVASAAWKLQRRTPAGFSRAYAYATLGGLAGSLVAAMLGDWMLPFVYNVTLKGFRASVLAWLLLGAMVGVGITETREPPNLEEHDR